MWRMPRIRFPKSRTKIRTGKGSVKSPSVQVSARPTKGSLAMEAAVATVELATSALGTDLIDSLLGSDESSDNVSE